MLHFVAVWPEMTLMAGMAGIGLVSHGFMGGIATSL